MQRVYGTAFLSEKDLKAHLTQLEEAKKRDHRKLGRELGLFTFHPWAPGAAFWQDKGTTLYNTLANYMRDVLLPNGYVEVKTPLIYNKALWETSGHWSHYRDNMFLTQAGVTGPHGNDRRADGVEGHELPGPFPAVRARLLLSRAADPFSRADPAAPKRSVRCAGRADARPSVFAGRWPLLRRAGTDRRRSRADAAADSARVRRPWPVVRRQVLDEAG
jgi:hypothetical protein